MLIDFLERQSCTTWNRTSDLYIENVTVYVWSGDSVSRNGAQCYCLFIVCLNIVFGSKKKCCLLFAYLTRIVAVCKTEPYKSFRYNISSTYILYGDKPGVCIVFCFTHRFVSLWFVDCWVLLKTHECIVSRTSPVFITFCTLCYQFLTKIACIRRSIFLTALKIGHRLQPFERKTVSTRQELKKRLIAIFPLLGTKPITSTYELTALSDK